jgi:hypothetical protein
VLVLLAVVAAVAVAPFLALSVHAHEAALASRQAAERFPVQALLVEDAALVGESAVATGADYAAPLLVHTRATWTAPQGTRRVGEIPVLEGTRAGETVTIWVTRDGTRTTAPLGEDAALRDAVGVALGAAVGVALAAFGLHRGVCRVIGRRRDRQWDAEWATVEPVWRGQLQ